MKGHRLQSLSAFSICKPKTKQAEEAEEKIDSEGGSSTGILACAPFAALTFDAQPRVAVLPDFFRKL